MLMTTREVGSLARTAAESLRRFGVPASSTAWRSLPVPLVATPQAEPVTRIALGIGSLALCGLAAVTPPSPLPRSGPVAGSGWPLLPGPDTVVRSFDPPLHPWLAGNRGVDLAGTPGEQVHAATSGVVSFAGQVGGVGVVAITRGPLRTTYEPIHPTVDEGDRVAAGDVIGRLTLAGSHCAARACLHWGLLRGQDYLDPLALLGVARVRLLPLD